MAKKALSCAPILMTMFVWNGLPLLNAHRGRNVRMGLAVDVPVNAPPMGPPNAVAMALEHAVTAMGMAATNGLL